MREIDKKEKEKLETLAREIIKIKYALRIGTSQLTPLNHLEEMEKFFKSDNYNPKYIYRKIELPDYGLKIDELKSKVSKLHIPQDLKEHILSFLDDEKNLYKTKISIGKNDFSENAHSLFDWGKDRLDLLLAKTPDVKFKMHIKHKMTNAEYIKERFLKTLNDYEVGGFEVGINNFSSHIINVGQRTINIGSQIKRFECNVDRLVVHEIESHVLQTNNIKNSTSALSELSKYGNQNLYSEGLAVFNEIYDRKITPSAFETYFFRIKAVRLLHQSFREIYKTLSEDINPHKAFVMTYRVKRGLSDTSKPGGFPKDAAYLLGFHEIENLINEGFNKKLLYATKSPVLTSLLDKYGLIDTEKLLTPQFYR
jgi:hypothetical protein